MRICSIALVVAGLGSACEWERPEWIPTDAHGNRVYIFQSGGKSQYVDRQGRIVAPPLCLVLGRGDRSGSGRLGPYNGVLHFSEGLAAVKIGKLWGFIDKKGTLVIPATFVKARPFSDGLALVHTAADGRGFIDRSGVMKFASPFPNVESFSSGLARVRIPGEGDVFVDRNGRQAFPERFASAGSFLDGLAHVTLFPRERGLNALIDTTGRHVFTCENWR